MCKEAGENMSLPTLFCFSVYLGRQAPYLDGCAGVPAAELLKWD